MQPFTAADRGKLASVAQTVGEPVVAYWDEESGTWMFARQAAWLLDPAFDEVVISFAALPDGTVQEVGLGVSFVT